MTARHPEHSDGGEIVTLPPHRPQRRRSARGILHRAAATVELRIAPALVGGAIAASLMNDAPAGVFLATLMFIATGPIERMRVPLALMPAARVGLGALALALGAGVAVLLLNSDWLGDATRTPIGLGGLLEIIVASTLTTLLGAWFRSWALGWMPVRVAVAGADRDLALGLAAAGVRSHRVIGWIGTRSDSDREHDGEADLYWLGDVADVRRAVIAHDVDILVWAPSLGDEEDVGAILTEACLDLPVRMLSFRQAYEMLLGHVPIGLADAAWYQYLVHPTFSATPPAARRLFDLVVGGVLGVLALPIVGIAALAIRLEDGQPVIYRQRRLGEGGREFWMLKLRSMREGAEIDGPQWADESDPRVTRVGRLLRRTHVDELPQLWNVIRGEMTLVGPRPERPEIVAELERALAHYGRRYLVKPGVTGWAQMRCGYAGSELGTAWKLCHELFYVKHRSLLLDSAILLQTLLKVLHLANRAVPMPDQRSLLRDAVLIDGFATGAVRGDAVVTELEAAINSPSATARAASEARREAPASADRPG